MFFLYYYSFTDYTFKVPGNILSRDSQKEKKTPIFNLDFVSDVPELIYDVTFSSSVGTFMDDSIDKTR